VGFGIGENGRDSGIWDLWIAITSDIYVQVDAVSLITVAE